MAIIQLSKIQHRTGANVDLPQLAEGEFGFATDERRLYIGNDANLYPPLGNNTSTQTEILTEVSTLNWSRLGGSANTTLNIEAPVEDGQLLVANSNTWTNAGGTSSLPINLGNIQNLAIGGGLNGYVLTTDGSGNLSWQGSGVVTYAIANVSQANPALVTTTEDNAILTGLQVTIFGVGGMTQLKTAGASGTNKFYVVKQSNSTFTLFSDSTLLSPVNSTGFTAATANTGNAVTSFYENGTGNPGGANRNIQFNDGSGLFGGIGTFTFDKTTANLSLVGNASITYDIAANNFNGNFSGPIGCTAPNSGAFTTVSAISTVSTAGNVSAGGNVVVIGEISTGSNVRASGYLSVTGDAKLASKLSLAGNIVGNLVPDTDIAYNLGSPTRRWKDLYISSNSLVIGNGTLSTSASGDFDFSNSNISSKNATLGNLATANFLGGTLIASSSSQPNISTVGNLTSLNVDGITNLGPVGNVIIGNSTTNYVLTAVNNLGAMQWLPTQYIETPAKGSNQSVQFNVGNVISGSANFLFDKDFNKLTVPNLVVGTSVTGNATVSVTGNITGNVVNATTLTTTGAVTLGNTANVAGNLTANGVVTINNNASVTGNVSVTGNLTANFTNLGNLSVFGNITSARLAVGATVIANGNVSGGNITTAGNVSAVGDVIANNITAANNASVAGNINATRVTTSAEVVAGQYIQVAGKAYIGEDVIANGNVKSNSNVFTSGNISAGGNLTIAANAQINGSATVSGTITGGNITTTGIISSANVNGTNITANGNISTTGNITANGAISANGNITTLGTLTANALNVGSVNTSGNLGVTNLSITGNVKSSLIPDTDITYDLGSPTKRWKSLYVSSNTIYIGNEQITADANGIGFGNGKFFQAKANINQLNVGVMANLPDVSKVTMGGGAANQVLRTDGTGNLSWVSPGSFTAGAAGANTQIQFNDSSAMNGSANFTFTKTSNTLTVDKIIANGAGLTALTGANVTGTVPVASVAGTISANAQPNITSIGNLTGLTVGYLVSNTFGNNLPTGNVDFYNAANVTMLTSSMRVYGNWAPGKSLVAVSPLSNTSTDTGKLAWDYASTMSAGASNIVVDTAANLIRFSVNTIGNVVTMSNTGLTASNLTVGGISNLGLPGNVKITGGTAGYLLRTDGAGNLSWIAPASSTSLNAGNSNINLEINGNFNVNVMGVVNAFQVANTGIFTGNAVINANANISTLNVTTIANLGSVANVRIAGGTSGYLLQATGIGNGVQWVAPASTSGLVNGNSNVAVDSSSLVRFSVAGTANILQVNSTGIITGLISASGTVTANGIAVINNGNITLPGTASTSGKVIWPGTSACSAPQLTTYSGGTRLVLQDSIATSGSAGYAMGIESGNMWFNTDVVAAGFKWYGGITQIATLNNANGFSAVGNVAGGNIVTGGIMSSVGNAIHGNISTAGNITANSNITGNNINFTTILSSTGNANVGNVNVTANVQAGNLRTTGNISATGNVNGNFFVGNGYYLTGILREPTALIANGVTSVNIPVAAGNIAVTVNSSSIMTLYQTSANITGNANVSGNISANYFIGNGALLSGIATSNQLFNGNSNVTIDANANVRISANGSANIVTYIGNGASYTTNANIGVVQQQGTYYKLGNAYMSSGADYGMWATHMWYNANNTWQGDGQAGQLYLQSPSGHFWYKGNTAASPQHVLLANLDPAGNFSTLGNITSPANITAANINAGTGIISTTGNANVGNVNTANINATANVQAGNLRTTGTLSATGNMTGNSYLFLNSYAGATEGAQIVMSFATSNVVANSGVSTWNIDVGPANDFRIFQYNASGALFVPFQISQANSNLTYTGNINSTANITAGNLSATGVVTAGGNITSTQYLNGAALSVTGMANITGNINATGKINSANGVVISGVNTPVFFTNTTTAAAAPPTIVAGYGNGTKLVLWDSKAGAATSLGYTMGIESATMYFTSDSAYKWYSNGSLTPIATLANTSGLSLIGNVTAPYFIGNGSQLTGIATSNLLFNGTSNVAVDPTLVRISANGTANVVTVTNNAVIQQQNHYYRLGNAYLSSGGDYTHIGSHAWFNGSAWTTDGAAGALMQISGQTFNWYKFAAGAVPGSVAASMILDGAGNLSLPGNLSVGGNTNVGGNLNVTGNTTHTGRTNLGAVGNVQITGGAAGQFLRTDGTGVLSWVAAGGTANVAGSPTQVQFNTGGAMDASANFTFDKTTNTLSITNTTVASVLSVNGNIVAAANMSLSSGNILSGGNISLGGTNANGKLIFSTNGVAPPALNGTSVGTRVILWPGVSASSTNYALGIDSYTMWMTVPDANSGFKFYGGTTQYSSINSTGFSVAGNIAATANISTTGNIIASGNLSVTGNSIHTGTTTLTGAVTAASTISAAGNINTAATLNAAALSVTGAAIHTGVINTTSTISATGTITGGNLVSTGTISAAGAVNVTGAISVTGNITTAGFIQAAGLTANGDISIPAANAIVMNSGTSATAKMIWTGGAGAPTYNAFSLGTKIVLYPGGSAPLYTPTASDVGYALGIENASLWYSTSHATNGWHRWYAGTNQIANLNYQALTVSGNLSTLGNVNSVNENVTSNVQAGNLRTTGVVSATSTITGGNVIVPSGGFLSVYGLATVGNLVVPTGGTVSAIGNVIGGNIVANGIVTGVTLSASGNVTGFNLTTGGSMSAASNVTGGNILTGGLISAASSITGLSLVGNIYTPRNGGIYWPSDTGSDVANITYIRPTGDVGILDFVVQNDADDIIRLSASGGTSVVGNLTVGANVVTTANVNAGNATITANVQAGNLRTTGIISSSGTLTAGNISTTGTLTLGSVISATGSPAAISATGTITTLSSISATGAITTAATISATGAITTANTISATGNITSAANISATAGIFAQTLSAIGNINSTGNIITNGTICTIGLIVNPGSSSNLYSALYSNSIISTSGDVTAANFSATGNVRTANVIATGAVSVGTNISIAGSANVGNINSNGAISTSGNATHANLLVNGNASITGTLTLPTANVTTLNVTGNANITSNLSVTGTTILSTLSVTGITTAVGNLNVTGIANLAASAVIQDPANSAVAIPIGYRTSPVISLVTTGSGALGSPIAIVDQYTPGKTYLITGGAFTNYIRWDGRVLNGKNRLDVGAVITVINYSVGTIILDGTWNGASFLRANSSTTTSSQSLGANAYATITKVKVDAGGDVWIVSGNF